MTGSWVSQGGWASGVGLDISVTSIELCVLGKFVGWVDRPTD